MAENIDTERERAAFGNYFCMTLSCNGSESQELIDACRAAAEDAWMERARRTPSASIGEDGLPELPKPECLLPGVYAYRAAMVERIRRDAVAADRLARRPRVTLDPEFKAALEEAAKTRSAAAILPGGEPVFINYGDQPEDMAHLECTACGGSGHVDDQRARVSIDGQLTGDHSPVKQAAQGVKRWQDRVHEMDGPYKRLELACQEIEDLRALIAQDGKPIYQVFIGHEGWNDIAEDEISGFQRDGFKVRTLYAAPPLSSEQQAGEGS